jgi:hypothetical protein
MIKDDKNSSNPVAIQELKEKKVCQKAYNYDKSVISII